MLHGGRSPCLERDYDKVLKIHAYQDIEESESCDCYQAAVRQRGPLERWLLILVNIIEPLLPQLADGSLLFPPSNKIYQRLESLINSSNYIPSEEAACRKDTLSLGQERLCFMAQV